MAKMVLITTTLIVLSLFLVGCVSSSSGSSPDSTKLAIPSSVSEKYVEMKTKYTDNAKFGALAYYCTKGEEAFYSVHGSVTSGTSGERYIFDVHGDLIETWQFDPNTGFETPADKINVKEYNCKTIDEKDIVK